MATVTLYTLWLNDALDPSDYQSFPFMDGMAPAPQQFVGLRQYAGGRQRAIVTPGRFQQTNYSLHANTPTQRQWLEDHAAVLVCARDDRGRKFFGIYSDLQFTDHQYDVNCDVTLTVSEVTYSEAVL